jgi:hypothetical protein
MYAFFFAMHTTGLAYLSLLGLMILMVPREVVKYDAPHYVVTFKLLLLLPS